MIKLDIGSGMAHNNDGWIGVDPFSKEANLRDYMWCLSFEDETVDMIYSSHSLEHVEKTKVMPTLKEWYRVLKQDGVVILRVPDLVWCCKHFIEYQSTGWDMDVIFGHQATAGEFHHTGFTEKILKDYCTNAGFLITKFEELNTHGQKTLSIELKK